MAALSGRTAYIAPILALLLLAVSGLTAGLVIFRLYQTETMVRHTYDVEVAIGDLESSLTAVGRSRISFVNSRAPDALESFQAASEKSTTDLDRIRQLTLDNPDQQALCDRMAANVESRILPSRQSVELIQKNQSTPEKQAQINLEVAKSAFDTAIIAQQMRRNEDILLGKRNQLSKSLFAISLIVLSVSFLLSAIMFWLHYHLLDRELGERSAAEIQLRQLSLQLMRVQDEERRRFARELHDGLGQILTGTKMLVDVMLAGNAADPQIAELSTLLDDAVTQTRSMSYLFHPPFLDDMGLSSAASWLVDGYARRTGLAITANIPPLEERLPRGLELTLYRVLQEALNNIHRHSRSKKAEIILETDAKYVTLRVKDYGKGIPNDTLQAFHSNRAQAGVGLMSMKERVKEQGGELEIKSPPTGTEIVVKIPFSAHHVTAQAQLSMSD